MGEGPNVLAQKSLRPLCELSSFEYGWGAPESAEEKTPLDSRYFSNIALSTKSVVMLLWDLSIHCPLLLSHRTPSSQMHCPLPWVWRLTLTNKRAGRGHSFEGTGNWKAVLSPWSFGGVDISWASWGRGFDLLHGSVEAECQQWWDSCRN